MKLNLNKPLLDLDGNAVVQGGEEVILGKFLAAALAAGKADEPIKFMDWAFKLHKEGEIEIDNADMDKMKSFVNEHQGMTVIAKGSLLKCFSEAENAA